MIDLIATLAVSVAASDAPERTALAQCMAYLAQAPEYASLSDDQIAREPSFLEAAKSNYCSDEASPFWRVAHERAHAKLGTEGNTLESQKLAEEEMRSILSEIWDQAHMSRAEPVALSPARKARFAQSWLSDDQNSKEVMALAEEPILCVGAAARAGKGLQDKDIMAAAGGTETRAFTTVGNGCGYESAKQAIARKIEGRFPDLGSQAAIQISGAFLGQMTFWSLTGQ